METHDSAPSVSGHQGKLELIALQQFSSYDNMYKVVDFLNRNLRERHLMFGLTKDEDTMTINIYEVE
ncbi:MAG: YpmA family protein [Peptococcaceae bacterium]|nr:YpmA family protein [Peptococcaceae bacterium]